MLYLIDSSAVLNDFGFEFSKKHKYLTTPEVVSEFKDMRSRHLMENALHSGLLAIGEPSPTDIGYVEDEVSKKGFSRLSKADISLLALGVKLKKAGKKFLLISDDFSIQNFCSLFKLPFEGAIRGKISEEIAFSLECPACQKKMPLNSREKSCPVCGSRLRKRAKIN